MPIINQVVTGSGGGGSVSEPYLEFTVDSNGQLSSTTNRIANFSGIKKIGYISSPKCGLYGAYANNTNISGAVVFDDLEEVTGDYVMYGIFYNCTGVTSASFPKLQAVTTNNCLRSAFQGDTNLTTASFPTLIWCNGFGSAFYGCTNLTSVSLPYLIRVQQNGGFGSVFCGCTNLTSVTFNKLATIATNNIMSGCFTNSGVTDVYFPGLVYSTTLLKNAGFGSMLSGTTGVTVHFPAELETLIKSFANYNSGFGGTNATILFDLPTVTTIDLHEIKELNVSNILYGCYQDAVNITTVDLSGLEKIPSDVGSVFSTTFNGCTALTNINISSLVASPLDNFNNTFLNCTSLPTVTFNSLKVVYLNFSSPFDGCTALTDVYLPALDSSIQNIAGAHLLNGTSNCTVHLPSNWSQNTVDLGGTNTTVLFDLPATVILTGANTTEYERNPKYDTATALAWRKKDVGTYPDFVIDWTPFYTSGTTDPSVGDTIYSDAACQTAVTTIGSIA